MAGFYADDPSGERGQLLPVWVDRVDPPGLLKTRIYVDLVDQDAASARTKLLATARGARSKSTEKPEYPGDRQSPAAPPRRPSSWGAAASLECALLPYYHPNPYFAGRQLLLAEVHTT
jgi:hypothetical protein